MNKREAAIISAYTGYLVGNFDDMCKYIEEIMQRPVFTHELEIEELLNEIHEKSKKDFVNIKIDDEENQLSVEEIEFLTKLVYGYADRLIPSANSYKDFEIIINSRRNSLNKLNNQKEMLER